VHSDACIIISAAAVLAIVAAAAAAVLVAAGPRVVVAAALPAHALAGRDCYAANQRKGEQTPKLH
jgi:hypothetical protein